LIGNDWKWAGEVQYCPDLAQELLVELVYEGAVTCPGVGLVKRVNQECSFLDMTWLLNYSFSRSTCVLLVGHDYKH
jgi:hypothetical protein